MLFIVIALLVFVTQSIFYHWWLIAADAFVAAFFFGKSSWGVFFSGFLAVALVWAGQAYYLSSRNDDLLLGKMAELLGPLPSPIWLLGITALMGGLVGGFSALTAYSIRSLWKK